MNTIRINTTNSTILAAGQVLISANTRDSKVKGEVSEELRYRNIAIPEIALDQSIPVKYQQLVTGKLYDLATERFTAHMKESNRLALEVNSADYTSAGLLEYFNSTVQSGRLTKELVEAWFTQSATYAKIVAKRDAATANSYAAKYAKLASPNHGTNSANCRSLLATLELDDLESKVAGLIAARLQLTIDKTEELVEAL